jgi:hypothetical protein
MRHVSNISHVSYENRFSVCVCVCVLFDVYRRLKKVSVYIMTIQSISLVCVRAHALSLSNTHTHTHVTAQIILKKTWKMMKLFNFDF